ncbi:MAG: hypothetical protein A2539_05665 [Elusimicrobia bacterium RIFOXYD2_FULL_34_15]|nr:MAG: hypothetical protein A2539_05665 [Elusimicrobia bacterium RIFOXYD2_FULL_34_15]
MSKIKILPSDLVSKIAAGEVIERPASVVKELIENSLDAGSKYIIAEIKKSGKELISITDDGCGMLKDDAILSIERHSTSKISNITDLETIQTLGFRGEALPSIASVSNLIIITKTSNSSSGFFLEVADSKIVSSKETGCPAGTTIEVKNIFYNVPARLKFLKSDNTEKNKIISLITEYAIVNFDVSFRLISDNKELFNYPPANSLQIRLAQIFGNAFIEELLDINFKHEQISISGFISKPDKTFLNRNRIFTFINKRPVNSKIIISAVLNGYDEFLRKKENPALFLMFDIKPESIDVNVHPTKREIKFKDEGPVYSTVRQIVRSRLTTKEVIPAIETKNENYASTIKPPENFSSAPVKYTTQEFSIPQSATTNFKKSLSTQLKYIGRIFELYILAEENDELLIIDQHAAQEKVLYEKLKNDISNKTLEIQNLLLPVNIELSPKEFSILQELKSSLEKLGFEIEEFGISSFIVKSIPAVINNASPLSIITEIIKQKKVGKISDASGILDDIMKTACKTAVKSGDKLSEIEIRILLDDLFKCSNPYTCPHGRPTITKITKDELDKRFLRK